MVSNNYWVSLSLLAAIMAGGCENVTTPTPGPAPVIACPAPGSATPSFDGNPVSVTYGSPTVTGGEAPVTTTCTPSSGANFAVGSTAVTCTARDAKQQSASCTFPVVVTKVPRLAATKFVAFGDSITEGVSSTCNRTTKFMTFAESMLVLPKAAVDDPWTYPNVLQARLRETYFGQLPVVLNRGVGGEEVLAGLTRLPGVLATATSEVLLLQEGANDVIQGHSSTSIVSALRSMIREGRNRGMQVFVGTLLPQRPLGVLGSCRGWGAADVPPVNDLIRPVVASEGAVLVDLYQAFGAVPGDLIGPDGLHPSAAGYQKIADTFFDAIKQRLER